ncbi:FAD-dependent monooxygenase, partial [Streptomyces sp. NPDC040724]|uniref:FAD-dependent monooxygenase n=1 Tax=Streptomyces sp. NPDC040724 TaxID=3155612 RepID=UPI0033E4B9D1
MTQRTDVVVIGGGQSGLAAGYHLRRLGIEHVILDAQDEKVQKQYERGLITKDERTQELIAIWTKATN